MPGTAETHVKDLIQLVGKRVRIFRKDAGLSRRALSERSGVSTRYLAQLEGGDGNISIGLLKQISLALDTPIEALIAPQNSELETVASLFLKADANTRAQVLQLLGAVDNPGSKANRICLIGLRGAGKSTLGALLAQDLEMPFLELNTEIERKIGVPIGEIIALYGEDGYREIEAETLNSIVATQERIVLAVAGGIVSSTLAFEQVLKQFHTVWVKATPNEHMDRVRAQGDLRPMAGNPQAMEQLRQILKAREVYYAQAASQLDTSGKTIDAARKELSALLRANNVVTSP